MDKTPLITIMTSYYNDQNFLADAISSVLAQTYTNFEYILVNHSSVDNSRKIARSFQDPRIKHIDLPMNYGGSGNILIKKVLEIGKGEYLKILCADDILRPNGLEVLVESALSQNADLLFGNVAFVKFDKTSFNKTWFENRYVAHLPTEEYLRHLISGTSEFPYAGNFVKISALKKIPIDYVSIQLADVGLWVAMLFNGARLAFADTVVGDYRIHPDQVSNAAKLSVMRNRCFFEHFLYYQNYFNAKLPIKQLQKIFPEGQYLRQLTENERDLVPFAITHALYKTTDIPACMLACRLKLAEFLNDYALQQRIEQRLGYTIKDLREDITNQPIGLFKASSNHLYFNREMLKNASLKELSYFFFRKLWFVISFHDLKEKLKRKKYQKDGIA